MCSNVGTPKIINFSFGTNGKLMILGVPIFKHFRVVQTNHGITVTKFIKCYLFKSTRNDQDPVVQSIVSLTSSLRGQLVKCFTLL